ncbi:glycosyltransferase family 25 protein [Helicobacter bizzozeronii]|uniref:glycosyltransferase family 25 protein n=1 Tax=Helicobacter bizzozeronii TaxID=56877 RepID=UPI000CEE4D7C|nr:glycosyltransferase family 25 protein [Helicobacter bizzozeronii]
MHIFVIHLSKQTCLKHSLKERNIESLLESLQNPKHPVEIFDAIYAKTSKGLHPLVQQHAHPYFVHASVQPDLANGSWEKISACFYALKYRGKSMSAGELGCYASHYLLWQKCIQLDEPIVILEDDIDLESHFFESLDFLQEHIEKLGYVRFMHLAYCEIRKNPTNSPHVFQINHLTDGMGTQGYCLTPKVARKFIKASQKWVMPVDWVMDNYYLHGVKNLVLEPPIISEHESAQHSTITRCGDRTPPFLLRLCVKLNRLYLRIYTRLQQHS